VNAAADVEPVKLGLEARIAPDVPGAEPAFDDRKDRLDSLLSASGAFVAVLIAVRVVVLVVAVFNVHTNAVLDQDIRRFEEVATERARPWRDARIEYPVGEVLLIFAIAGYGLATTATVTALLAFTADLGIAWLLHRHWGRRAAVGYLIAGLPLLVFIYLRLDLVSVFLAVLGMALCRTERERIGGVTIAAAVLFRVWPLLLLPALLLRRRYRAFAWALGGVAAGGVAWVVWGGLRAPMEVLTYRGATGWEVGSTLGVLVWVLGRATVRFEDGSWRVGHAPAWTKFLSVAGLCVVLAVIWARARRWRMNLEGTPAAVAVAALLFFSPVLSHQYVAWLLPWAAIAGSEGDGTTFGLTCAVAVLTVVPYMLAGHLGLFQAVTLARDVLLATMVLVWLRRTKPSEPYSVFTRRL
jgi:hypothetical protein